MKKEYIEIINYVTAASNLAEQLQGDIIKGDKISIETIVLLSKFHSAANKMSKLIDMVNQSRVQLN